MKTKKNEKVKNEKKEHKLFSHIKEQYDAKQAEWKAKIKAEPKKGKRFWKWVWYWIAFPWVWLFYNIRDWRSAICILVSPYCAVGLQQLPESGGSQQVQQCGFGGYHLWEARSYC